MTTNQALVDLDRLPSVFPHGVARAAELAALGFSGAEIERCCGPAGPWQQLDDGVVLMHQSKPAREHRLQAALGVAAPGAVITGREAMWLHGLPVFPLGAIHLLVAGRAAERNDGSVVVERVARLPDTQLRHRFPVAPLVRATVDACLRTRSIGEIKVLLLEATQRGGLAIGDVYGELQRERRKGTSILRAVLADMRKMEHRLHERLAKEVVKLAGLPAPTWRTRLSTGDNVHLGTVDAWWPDVGLAWDADIDRPGDPCDDGTAATRLSRYLAAGVIAAHTVPTRLREHTEAVAGELRALYQLASATPMPNVRAYW
ncbi:hypothetical protein [Actinokineospora fastidiosa]|uniref:Transcriptional regulator, AbiEi antitoxin, Type IV TA system n=1 Tax=Actinokineospora fastidiosa TaxID=1816 RepID=A0A918GJQ9_9PSEU|nr:hypothetical protein [Actinokineospora fastidiosa]GGS41314.1 hypothetical protein GCM10010171_39950 [Actinokineospora fastidiosa]